MKVLLSVRTEVLETKYFTRCLVKVERDPRDVLSLQALKCKNCLPSMNAKNVSAAPAAFADVTIGAAMLPTAITINMTDSKTLVVLVQVSAKISRQHLHDKVLHTGYIMIVIQFDSEPEGECYSPANGI